MNLDKDNNVISLGHLHKQSSKKTQQKQWVKYIQSEQ